MLLWLGALPPSWKTFVTTQNINTNTTLIDLINCIRQEEAMKKAHNPKQTQVTKIDNDNKQLSNQLSYKTKFDT